MQGQPPTVEFVMAFCEALSISADWLLTGRGPMLAGEVRGHVLKTSAPTDLLGSMAERLRSMRSRLERVEVYVQTLETRVRANRVATGANGAESELKAPRQGRDGHSTADTRTDWIADAVAQRPSSAAG